MINVPCQSCCNQTPTPVTSFCGSGCTAIGSASEYLQPTHLLVSKCAYQGPLTGDLKPEIHGIFASFWENAPQRDISHCWCDGWSICDCSVQHTTCVYIQAFEATIWLRPWQLFHSILQMHSHVLFSNLLNFPCSSLTFHLTVASLHQG